MKGRRKKRRNDKGKKKEREWERGEERKEGKGDGGERGERPRGAVGRPHLRFQTSRKAIINMSPFTQLGLLFCCHMRALQQLGARHHQLLPLCGTFINSFS